MKVLIVGAGAAGLMAARELTKNGVDVVLVEANGRMGGRIHTLQPPGFSQPIEAGAEFIHGSLPLTLELLRQAGLQTTKAGGRMYRFENGGFTTRFGSGAGWEAFYEKLGKQQRDITLIDLLDTHFPETHYSHLRGEVIEMAQGLDLADASKLSVFSIREEWLSEATQFRPVGGYGPLLDFILADADAARLELHRDTAVAKLIWQQGRVEAVWAGGVFVADAAVVTTSVGHLQQRRLTFKPAVAVLENALSKIGFGSVIKFVLEFQEPFWERSHPDLGFLFTRDGFTFWTQLSQRRALLTGWIGDAYVPVYSRWSDAEITAKAQEHLKEAFPETVLQAKASSVFRYDQHSNGGAYSWLLPESFAAIESLQNGIDATLWFAGEAWHPGAEVGTVEAALQSGKTVAYQILQYLQIS